MFFNSFILPLSLFLLCQSFFCGKEKKRFLILSLTPLFCHLHFIHPFPFSFNFSLFSFLFFSFSFFLSSIYLLMLRTWCCLLWLFCMVGTLIFPMGIWKRRVRFEVATLHTCPSRMGATPLRSAAIAATIDNYDYIHFYVLHLV